MNDTTLLPPSINVGKRYRIGRSAKTADIVINDPRRTVSSFHAELLYDDLGRWYLKDHSTNGTFVLRAEHWIPLKEGFINIGEQLRLGGYKVTVTWLVEQIRALEKQGSNPEITVIHPSEEKTMKRKTGRYVRDPETGAVRWQTD